MRHEPDPARRGPGHPQSRIVAAAGPPRGRGEHDDAHPLRQIANYLAPRRALLLLDNAERLLDAAPLLVELLAAAPGLRLLVTSRERLNVRPETVFALDGLAFPPAGAPADTADYAAVRLFIGAARRVRADFSAAFPVHAISLYCHGTDAVWRTEREFVLEGMGTWSD